MRNVEIHEGCLLEIFARIGGDVRDLVRCSLVCKQWKELCWAVPALHFNFKGKLRLNQQEGIIANILQKTTPHLQELEVVLGGGVPTGEWLVHAGTFLKKLELTPELTGSMTRWGSGVWSALSSFHCLESLVIRGDSLLTMPMPKRSPFQSLTSCSLEYITAAMVEALLAASPVLRHLEILEFQDESRDSMELSSASLESLEMRRAYVDLTRSYAVSFDTPMLGYLTIGIGDSPVELIVVSMANLRAVEFSDACVISSSRPFENLEKVTINGCWSDEQLISLLRHTPTVTDFMVYWFGLHGSVLPIAQTFAPLRNLETLTLDGLSLQSFGSDTDAQFVFEGLTMHLSADNDLEDKDSTLDILKRLLGVHGVQLLVVHYSLKEIYHVRWREYWQILLDLVLLYPNRVEFQQA